MTVPPGDPDGRGGYVEKQLDATIDAWLTEWGGKLERFARDAVADQQLRADRPGSAALRDYVDRLLTDLTAGDAADPDVSPRTLLRRFGEHSGKLASSAFTFIQGMSPENARTELEQFRRRSAQKTGVSIMAEVHMINDFEQAAAVQRNLKRLAAAEALLPTVLELGGYLLDHQAQVQSEQRRAELRTQLREQADRIAEYILDGGTDGRTWSAAVTAVRADVQSKRTPPEVTATAEQRKQIVDGVLVALADLMADVPSPILGVRVP